MCKFLLTLLEINYELKIKVAYVFRCDAMCNISILRSILSSLHLHIRREKMSLSLLGIDPGFRIACLVYTTGNYEI